MPYMRAISNRKATKAAMIAMVSQVVRSLAATSNANSMTDVHAMVIIMEEDITMNSTVVSVYLISL